MDEWMDGWMDGWRNGCSQTPLSQALVRSSFPDIGDGGTIDTSAAPIASHDGQVLGLWPSLEASRSRSGAPLPGVRLVRHAAITWPRIGRQTSARPTNLS